MNENDNNVESLAAFLNGGKSESEKEIDMLISDLPSSRDTKRSDMDIDDILLSVDSVRKKRSAAVKPKRKDAPEKPVVIEDDDDEYDSSPKQRKAAAKQKSEKAAEKTPEDNTGDLFSAIGIEKPPQRKIHSAAVPPDTEDEDEDEEDDVKTVPDLPQKPAAKKSDEEEPVFDAAATRMMNAVGRPAAAPADESGAEQEETDEEPEMSREERRRLVQMRRSYEKQKQRTRTFAYVLLGVFLSVIIVGTSAYSATHLIKWALDFTGIGATEFKLDVDIPDKADVDAVAAILAENNIITSPQFFKFYTDFSDKFLKDENEVTDFVGGTYTLSSTMQYSTLLHTLRSDAEETKTVTVRITEGMTAREIGELLEENNVCYADDFEQFYRNVQNNYEFERRVIESPLKFNQLEGYLFPDTYEFFVVNAMETGAKATRSMTLEEAEQKLHEDSVKNAEQSAKKMYSNFNDKITRSMYKKMGDMHLTLDEVMAIASLVQREAAYAEDMELVASVFLNRIRNSETFPYLQSDVSVLYVENDIKPYIKGSQETKEKIYKAYNTYTCRGIPSGAVCNPGLDAINAVLYAASTNYYYFCANPDTGDIYYASTHSEHVANFELAGLVYDPSKDSYFESDARFE